MESGVKWFIGLMAAAAIALGLCLPSPQRARELDPRTGQPKVMITYVGGGLGRDRLLFDELKSAFELRHPGIQLKLIRATSLLARKVDTMISGGVAPDVLSIAVDKAGYYLEAGALRDLTPFLAGDAELARDLGPDGDFYEIMLEPFRRGDRQFMIPIWYTPFFVYYNRDLFDKYNVPYPSEDWDWADMREMAGRLTHDVDGDGRIDEFGLYFAQWQHGVETFILQNGVSLLAPDGVHVDLNQPRVLEALRFLHALKFADRVSPSSVVSPGASPARLFGQGKIGMFGPWGVFSIVDFRSQMRGVDWDVAVLPRGPGGRRAGLVFPTAFGVSSQSKHPREAFEFVRFLASPEGQRIIARWALFVPCRASVARSEAFLDPETKPDDDWVLIHDVENGYAHLPAHTSTRYDEIYEILNDHIMSRMLDLGLETPEEAAAAITRKANRIVDRARRADAEAGRSPLVLWAPVAGGLALALAGGAYAFGRRGACGPLQRAERRWGYALISPWIAGFLCLTLGPMLFSIGLSLCEWHSLSSLGSAQFVGLENYAYALSGSDEKFYKSLQVTLKYTALAVPLNVLAGLALALLLNHNLRGIRLLRTLYYLPAVLPSVAVTVLWWYLFRAQGGWVNHILGWLGIDGVNWLGDSRMVVYVFVLMTLWAAGGGMIINLAGLQAIPTSLYEAAEIDGAGAWHRFRYVTLPMMSPVLFFNLVMGIIGSFQVFNQAFVMYDGLGGPDDAALFYVLHLFSEAITRYRFGYGSALAWILFTIILGFTLLVFKSSPLWVYYEGRREE